MAFIGVIKKTVNKEKRMCIKPAGARVNTIVAPPGGCFTIEEMEKVLFPDAPVIRLI